MTAPLDIPAIRKLLEGVTQGPWEEIPQHGAGPIIAHPYETGSQMNPRGLRLVCHVLARGNSLKQDEANARFIASTRTLVPQLCDEVERLMAAVAGKNRLLPSLIAEGIAIERERAELAEARIAELEAEIGERK
jgi:hypothetical protein